MGGIFYQCEVVQKAIFICGLCTVRGVNLVNLVPYTGIPDWT
jgi:hypothetical protein